MEDKQMPGFMTYREVASMLLMLNESEKAAAIDAICKYFLSGEITELQGNAAYVFELQKDSIERGREGYLKKVEGGKYGANVRYGKTDL